MIYGENPQFDYDKEPSRDILCIDCKSFYASVEAVSRGLDPLKVKLVVMSYPAKDTKRGSGLILASSPAAKKAYGITNVSRARDLPYPYPKDLKIVPPRMKLYMKMNQKINQIYLSYVDKDNHAVYSVDESFLDVTGSLRLFGVKTAYGLARKIQADVLRQTGIYTTVGIGDNPLLAKLAMDNGAKHQKNMIAEWRYEQVPETVWKIPELTDFWGIGRRTAKHLEGMGVQSIYDLAHTSYYELKDKFGVAGTQLYANAWGIDRSFIGESYKTKEKSIGNSQVLPRDYDDRDQIELVIKEMADQVATRLRRAGVKARVLSLWLGYSLSYRDRSGRSGFHQQLSIPATNQTGEIAYYLLEFFKEGYEGQVIRSIGVNSSRLVDDQGVQLDLFMDPKDQEKAIKTDRIVDTIRRKYGFKSIVRANSLLEGGRAIARSGLVGGHAGGMSGIEGEGHGKAYKERI